MKNKKKKKKGKRERKKNNNNKKRKISELFSMYVIYFFFYSVDVDRPYKETSIVSGARKEKEASGQIKAVQSGK